MTTEATHYYIGPSMACGASVTAEPGTTRLGTTTRDGVTCPACLTAMGEPRVVSGTDAVAAPAPVKPTHVAAGHAWRVGRKLGRTLYRDGECVGIVDTPELAAAIVAALGLAAPVETPRLCDACRQPEIAHAGDCVRIAALAAPAPGAGEGREMTFAEACAAPDGSVQVEWADGPSHWVAWSPNTFHPARVLVSARYRLKPEPLPAPAPRPSRVLEMVDLEAGRALWNTGNVTALCERVVKDVSELVRGKGFSGLATVIEHEFLEPRK